MSRLEHVNLNDTEVDSRELLRTKETCFHSVQLIQGIDCAIVRTFLYFGYIRVSPWMRAFLNLERMSYTS